MATRWVATTRSKSSFAPRHGKAVEPTWTKQQEEQAQANESANDDDVAPIPQEKDAAETAKPVQPEQESAEQNTPKPGAEKEGAPELEQPSQAEPTTASTKAAEPPVNEPEETVASTTEANTSKTTDQQNPATSAKDEIPATPSLDAVLHMPSPDKVEHPHMTASPYVHHFDSYSLVRLLEEGGYSKEQAVTSMKAIRKILAQNLDVAQKSLVSKSDVENVSVNNRLHWIYCN